MTENLPAPPVPIDADLRDFDGFMLNVERLLASELWALASGEEFKAAVGLWCRSWKQVPPGSLPNDERVLAAFSGAGRRWKSVRDMAMRGFYLCSDGRLYHRVLCEDVLRAIKAKEDRRERTRAATEARKTKRDGSRNDVRDEKRDVARDVERDVPHKGNVTRSHRQDRTGQKERKKESTPPPSSPEAARAEPEAGDEAMRDAVIVIRVFDHEQRVVFGEERKRPWPHGTDSTFARKWLDAGADLNVLRSVFQAAFLRQKAEGTEPSASLKHVDASVMRAITEAKRVADPLAIPGFLDRTGKPSPDGWTYMGRPTPLRDGHPIRVEHQHLTAWLRYDGLWSEPWTERKPASADEARTRIAALEPSIWPDAGTAETRPNPGHSGAPKPTEEA